MFSLLTGTAEFGISSIQEESMRISKLGNNDVDVVHQFGSQEQMFTLKSSAPVFWTKEQLARWFHSADGVCLGAFTDDQLVGFVLATFHAPTGKATWENLFVAPSARRQNVGLSLGVQLITDLHALGTFHIMSLVDLKNKSTQRLHQRLGFQNHGTYLWLGRTTL